MMENCHHVLTQLCNAKLQCQVEECLQKLWLKPQSEEEAHKAELLAQEKLRRKFLEEVAEIEQLREAVRQVQEENKRLREQADLLIASCAELPIARVVHNTQGLTTNYPMISDESEDPC